MITFRSTNIQRPHIGIYYIQGKLRVGGREMLLLLLLCKWWVSPRCRGHPRPSCCYPWGTRAPRSVLQDSANVFAGSRHRVSSPHSVLPNSLCLAANVPSHWSQCSRLCRSFSHRGQTGSTDGSSLSWTYSRNDFWWPDLSWARKT